MFSALMEMTLLKMDMGIETVSRQPFTVVPSCLGEIHMLGIDRLDIQGKSA